MIKYISVDYRQKGGFVTYQEKFEGLSEQVEVVVSSASAFVEES